MSGIRFNIGLSDQEIEEFRERSNFDEDWYLNEYPDVAQSGLDPIFHFLWLGRKLGRRLNREPGGIAKQSIAPRSACDPGGSEADQPSIIFVDGTSGTSSTHYRINRIADGLAARGWKIQTLSETDLTNTPFGQFRCDIAVFFRAPYWEPYVSVVESLRRRGTIVVYDIDDLVFEESLMPMIDGVKYLNEDQKAAYVRGMKAYKDFILNSDLCTTSTKYLVDQVRKYGVLAARVKNTISDHNLAWLQSVSIPRKKRPAPFVVGYYSGTKTHQGDFAVVAPALVEFMSTHPDVVLRVVGELDLMDWPELFGWQKPKSPAEPPRVTSVGLMPHDVMLRDQLNCDLIIAALEVGNPFCEAKSELKFFEAAMAGIPVIVSATSTFLEATKDGTLALTASDTADWLHALNEVYSNYDAAISRAALARQEVAVEYSSRAAVEAALAAYCEAATAHGASWPAAHIAQEGRRDVCVILPDITGPSGGHRKIFSVCEAMIEEGHKVTLYVMSDRAVAQIKEFIETYFGKLAADVMRFAGAVGQHDLAICTSWSSAYEFRRVKFTGETIYFVQDFEPMFNAVGSEYIRALSTYSFNHKLICYGNWVGARLRSELGLNPAVIPFTLDHDVYAPPTREGPRDIDILLFGRPSQDRRCFSLIVEGLQLLKARKPEVKIGIFGEDRYPEIGLEFASLGAFSNVADLAALYARTKVGICYSTTNPSQLGYEMIACGVCLVDVRVKDCELNFGGDSFVSYCDGTPESMADICRVLLEDEQSRENRQLLGYEFVKRMPADDELGAAFVRAAGLSLNSRK